MRKPWQHSSEQTRQERGYGRDHEKMRAHLMATVVLCEECKRQGRATIGRIADHIIPKAQGGGDSRENYQLLCEPCHDAKSAAERPAGQAAANHPAWLERSAIPVTIIAGPPCAGKSTYAETHGNPDDTIIDLDRIAAELSPTFRQWSSAPDKALLNRAIRARNTMLSGLSRATSGAAWFIVSAPTEAERSWWRDKLGGKVVLLDPGRDECKARAVARGTPRAVAGIDAWHKASRIPWRAPTTRQPKRTIGLDGWPI